MFISCFLTRKNAHFQLGHFINKEGVSTDPTKIQVVGDWLFPQNITQLRGFLGLAGYYRRFVKDFGEIARPLTDMLEKDNFDWSVVSTQAFTELKHDLVTASMLCLLDFTHKFVVETDASGKGIKGGFDAEKPPGCLYQ